MSTQQQHETVGIFKAIGIVLSSIANIAVRSVSTVEKGFDNVDKGLDATFQLACAAEKHSKAIHCDAAKECAEKVKELDKVLKQLES